MYLEAEISGGKVTIELDKHPTLSETIDAFIGLLLCQGYGESTIAEMLINCEIVDTHLSRQGVKYLTRQDLADCLPYPEFGPQVVNEVLDAVFGEGNK
jgi:hypothetical protein